MSQLVTPSAEPSRCGSRRVSDSWLGIAGRRFGASFVQMRNSVNDYDRQILLRPEVDSVALTRSSA